VYVDETGIDTFVYRDYAYAKRGEKVLGFISGKKYKRVGIVAALMNKKIVSPLQYDGAMDSVLFELWFEKCLLPELPPNSVIVMDNASFHRKGRLIVLAHNLGHTIIFLPPYSPELNLIEYSWSWLKNKLKKVAAEFDCFDEALRYCFRWI